MVGIVGPIFTARAAGRRLDRQLGHERVLHDLDRSRQILDAVIAEGEEIRPHLINAFALYSNADFEQAMDEITAATDQLPHLSGEAFRLSLMRGLEDALVAAVQKYVESVRTASRVLNAACPNEADIETDDLRADQAQRFREGGHEQAIWAIDDAQKDMASLAAGLIGTKDSE